VDFIQIVFINEVCIISVAVLLANVSCSCLYKLAKQTQNNNKLNLSPTKAKLLPCYFTPQSMQPRCFRVMWSALWNWSFESSVPPLRHLPNSGTSNTWIVSSSLTQSFSVKFQLVQLPVLVLRSEHDKWRMMLRHIGVSAKQ